jgi:fibronectin-binding autotransporter adhesin
MKSKSNLRSFLLAAGSSLLAVSSASGQATLTWDITPGTIGVGNGSITGGTGNWNTTNGNWTSDAGANNVSWDADNSNNDTAIFNASGIGGTGTVTLGETIDLSALTFSNLRNSGPTQKYTITGGTLAFSGVTKTITTGTSLDNVTNAEYASINSAITGAPNVSMSWSGGNNVLVFAPASGSQALGTVTGAGIVKLAGSTTGNSIVGLNSASSGKISLTSGEWTLTGTATGYEHFITGGTLIISGSGSLQNNNRSTNFSGGTLHWNTAGAIKDNTISTARDRDFNITGGSIDNTSGGAITSSHNPQMLWGGNWTFIGSNGANSNLSMGTGDVFITGATRQVTVTNAATTLTVGGVVAQNGGTYGLTKAGDGTLLLSGASANTYTGTTTINGGILALNKTGVNAIAGAISLGNGATTAGNDILRLNASNQIADTSVITFNAATGSNAAIFRLNNQSETVAGIASTGGGGIIENESGSAGTSTLTVNNAALQSFSGIIRDGDGSGSDGTLALTKSGNGTLTLTNSNSYTGATNINAGTLQLDGSTHASSTVNIGTSGTLTGSGTVNGNATLTGSGIINKSSGTIAGTLGVTGGNWNGAGTVTGLVTSSSGIFTIGSGANLTANGDLNVTGGTLAAGSSSSTITGSLNYTSASNSSFGGVIAGSGKTVTVNNAAATLTLGGTNSYTGNTDVTAGKLIVNGNISTSLLTTVALGATLGGTGTLGKTIINGTLAVGNSPGTMTFTDTLGLSGTDIVEIDGTSGAGVPNGHDFVNLTGIEAAGVLTYGGTMTLDIGVLFGIGTHTWNLFDMASETGTFTTISLTDQYSGSLLDTNLDGIWNLNSGDNSWQFTESSGVLSLTVIPEPNVAALIGGFGMLCLLRRRR